MSEEGGTTLEQRAGGPVTAATPPVRPRRFAGVTERERWGYIVWGTVAPVIAIPEITAAAHRVPWPTISSMVGHLEYRWSWVGLIVMALIVFVSYHVVRYPPTKAGPLATLRNGGLLGRTAGGRFTRRPPAAVHEVTDEDLEHISIAWLVASAVAVAGGSLITVVLRPHGRFLLGYVLYGLIGMFGILIPSVLAFVSAREVPFPTLLRTIHDLERRVHFAAVILVVALAILLLHLALYPWPGIAHLLQNPTPRSP